MTDPSYPNWTDALALWVIGLCILAFVGLALTAIVATIFSAVLA